MTRMLSAVYYRGRQLLRSFGFDVIRYAEPVESPIDLLSHFVRELVAASGKLLLVQVGAHDGIMQDPVRKLILEFRLHAVLIEPLPDAFLRLNKSYESIENVRLVNAGVAREDGILTLFRVREDAPFGAWVQGIASFNRAHFSRFDVPGLDQYVEEIEVPCVAWTTLTKDNSLAVCDILVVDTEGMDDEIVEGALEAGLRPAVIQYEWCHLPARRRARCKAKLVEYGYQFVDVGIDTMAVMPDRFTVSLLK